MKTLAKAVALCAVLVLGGCSSVSVTTDHDPDCNFAALKTYEWLSSTKDALSANAQTNMFQNSMIEKRFQNAVVEQLKAKGITEDTTKPDFVIMYYAGTQNKVNVTNYGYGYGRWGGYGGGGVDVQQYTEGTIILDFYDAKTKQLVWRGTASGALASKPSPEEATEKLNGVVAKMLADYPPKPKSK